MEDVRHIYWTGGWDSTFRVLELLTDNSLPVQPHYVIDPRRTSATMEIETMQRLRTRFITAGLATVDSLREPRLYQRDAIAPDNAVEEAFSTLARTEHIGNQYSWLSRLARAEGLSEIELCVVHPELPQVRVCMKPCASTSDAYVTPRGQGAVSEVFEPFTFPLLDRDDQTLRRQAAERGWEGFLAETCFCHTPVRGRHPCGTCRPCVLMMERKAEGSRLGLIGKARYWAIERVIRALPSALEWRCRQWQENLAALKLSKQ